MKKDKNKGKKTLAAVGVVVAAGLSPGAIAASAAGSSLQTPNAAITAAEVVAMDGSTYSFDELYALQQPGNGRREAADPQHASRYGALPRPDQHVTMYGVQRPQHPPHPPVIVHVSATLDTIQDGLMDYCVQLLDADPYTQGVLFTLDSDLTSEMGMSEDQLKELKTFIEEYYGVEVSYHRFRLKGQLNTLGLIAEYIYKLKTLWD
jgi:hypothetical protein